MRETKIILEQTIPVRLFITEEGEKLISLNDLKKFLSFNEQKNKNNKEKELVSYLQSLILEYPNLILSSTSEYYGVYYREKNKNAKESLFYVHVSKKHYAVIFVKNFLIEKDLSPILHEIENVRPLTKKEIEERNNKLHPDYPEEELSDYDVTYHNMCHYKPQRYREDFWIALKAYIVNEIGENNYNFWNNQEFNPFTSKTKEELFFNTEITYLNLPILNRTYWETYKSRVQEFLAENITTDNGKQYIEYYLDDFEYLAGLASDKEIKSYDEFYASELMQGHIFDKTVQRKYRDTTTLKPKSQKDFVSIMEDIFEHRVGQYLDSKTKI